MSSPRATTRAGVRLRCLLGAAVVLLGAPVRVDAQGLVQGVQQGAQAGNKAAGPVGGVLGGAIGGVVGVVTGVTGGFTGKGGQPGAAPPETKQGAAARPAKGTKTAKVARQPQMLTQEQPPQLTAEQ